VSDGWTPYITTFNLVHQVIESDIRAQPEDIAATTRYVVVFLGDGEPCHIRQQDDQWIIVGEDFDEILNQIDRILALEKSTGGITIHTSYLLNEEDDRCNNQWTDEIPDSSALLAAIATRGEGIFKEFSDANDIDFLEFITGTVFRPYLLNTFLAFNRNARLALSNNMISLLPDTDGDGLLDQEELYHGTNPLDEDTDGDGCRDGVEVKKDFWPLTGLKPRPTGRLDPCGDDPNNSAPIDTDKDGLYDREELLVTLTNRLMADTDRDNLVDGVEFMAGSSPHYNDQRIPLDGDEDGQPDWNETREHTLPKIDEEMYEAGSLDFYSYNYSPSIPLSNQPNGKKCYHFKVENIALVETMKTKEDPTWDDIIPNEIDIYMFQHVEGFSEAPSIIRKGTFQQKYIAPDKRNPNRRKIIIESTSLELITGTGD
jgi:hypothetical protein